ncbi:hypothetical protein HFP15_33545 [Amycolatopsis sp. K13G38]|uniref:MFS transporter n=1 Tax=Amycolatopsis acididurans TaxID=2724524 RepID=A0ABX1JDC8_9PSEU|nr:hypothetical protein [Amycolatopsis acididurans]NKQ57797.1 hypothetical protein [Amycolatopsis acididurans]
MRPGLVVLGWAAFNAVLASIMFAYGESLEFIGLYAAAVLITVVVGLVVIAASRPRSRRRIRTAAGSRSAGFLALAAILFALGFLFTHWISYLALFPLLAGGFSYRRERLPAGVVPARTGVRSTPVVPQEEHPAADRVARMVTAGALAARAFSALRPGRRRS